MDLPDYITRVGRSPEKSEYDIRFMRVTVMENIPGRSAIMIRVRTEYEDYAVTPKEIMGLGFWEGPLQFTQDQFLIMWGFADNPETEDIKWLGERTVWGEFLIKILNLNMLRLVYPQCFYILMYNCSNITKYRGIQLTYGYKFLEV